MSDVNDIHKFYEANLPGYQRKDLLAVNKFFLKQIGLPLKNPIKQVFLNFKLFKAFVTDTWQGVDDVSTKPLPAQDQETKIVDEYGKCVCGHGKMVKRQNRQKGNYFLGCSRYPACKNTKPWEDE